MHPGLYLRPLSAVCVVNFASKGDKLASQKAWPQLVDAVVTAQHDQRALTAELVGRSSLGWAMYRKSPVKICFCNVLGIYPESVEHTGIELEFHKSKCWPREKMTKMVIGCHWRCSGVLPVVCDDDDGSGVLASLSLVSEWGRSIIAKQVVFLSNNWVVLFPATRAITNGAQENETHKRLPTKSSRRVHIKMCNNRDDKRHSSAAALPSHKQILMAPEEQLVPGYSTQQQFNGTGVTF